MRVIHHCLVQQTQTQDTSRDMEREKGGGGWSRDTAQETQAIKDVTQFNNTGKTDGTR